MPNLGHLEKMGGGSILVLARLVSMIQSICPNKSGIVTLFHRTEQVRGAQPRVKLDIACGWIAKAFVRPHFAE